MMPEYTIRLPDINYIANLDRAWLEFLPLSGDITATLDFTNITSLYATGIVNLYVLVRHIVSVTGNRVHFTGLNQQTASSLFQAGLHFSEHINSTDLLVDIDNVEMPSPVSLLHDIKHCSDTGLLLECVSEELGKCRKAFDQPVMLLNPVMDLCHNALEHSGSEINEGQCFACFQIVYGSNNTQFILAVSDLGIGIKSHMLRRHTHLVNHSDAEIIKVALSGVTGRTTGRGGLGLKGTASIAQQYGGSFTIRSGTGLVVVGDGMSVSKTKEFVLPGTHCRITLNTYKSVRPVKSSS